MDSGGRIYTGDEIARMDLAARKAADLVPIPKRELGTLLTMSVPERMAWHAKRKAARVAAKRARKARRKNRGGA